MLAALPSTPLTDAVTMSSAGRTATNLVRRYLVQAGKPVHQSVVWADLSGTGMFKSKTHFKQKVLASMRQRGEVRWSDALWVLCARAVCSTATGWGCQSVHAACARLRCGVVRVYAAWVVDMRTYCLRTTAEASCETRAWQATRSVSDDHEGHIRRQQACSASHGSRPSRVQGVSMTPPMCRVMEVCVFLLLNKTV